MNGWLALSYMLYFKGNKAREIVTLQLIIGASAIQIKQPSFFNSLTK
jgi:hypothetical protein